MYVKIANGKVDQYPYTIGELRRDNPTISFPKNITENILNGYNVFKIKEESVPEFDERTQTVTRETKPTLVDGSWTLRWTVSDKSSEDIAEYDAAAAESTRRKRDNLLTASDWTQARDVVLSNDENWQTYRQSLRDITDHANFPHLNDDDWPSQP